MSSQAMSTGSGRAVSGKGKYYTQRQLRASASALDKIDRLRSRIENDRQASSGKSQFNASAVKGRSGVKGRRR